VIYEAAIFNDPDDAQLRVWERQSILEKALLFLAGFILIDVGGLVTGLFLSGSGPNPLGGTFGLKTVLGCCWVVFAFCALGLFPLYSGLKLVFVRHTYVLRPNERTLESRLTFAGLRLSVRSFAFAAFKQLAIEQSMRSGFARGAAPLFTVICEGQHRVELAAFRQRPDAEAFAAAIALQMGLLLRDPQIAK
jgi:hypothetical protein